MRTRSRSARHGTRLGGVFRRDVPWFTLGVWFGALGLTYVLVRRLSNATNEVIASTGTVLCPGLVSGIPDGAPPITLHKPVDAPWGSPYGMRMLLGQPNCHNGQDFGAPLGREIRAAGAGSVAKAWADDLNGNAVNIAHAGGWATGYAHMVTPAFVAVNQRVYEGQLIGKVGNTGNTTGPHLHLSVFYKGQAVNPRLVVQDVLATPNIA